MATWAPALTKEYLAYLKRLAAGPLDRVRHSVSGGRRKSGSQGSSMEFSDFRPYVPGDDVRRLDKRSVAREGELYTKVFLEEKQALVEIYLDGSGSMAGEKGSAACLLAASIAYVALERGDKAELVVFGEGLRAQRKRLNPGPGFWQAVSFLEETQFQGQTDLLKAVSQAMPVWREGLCYLISDGFTQGETGQALAAIRGRGRRLFFLQVLSPQEEKPDFLGDFALTDVETDQKMDLSVDEALVAAYQKALKQFQSALEEEAKRSGGIFLCHRTTQDVRATMQTLFVR